MTTWARDQRGSLAAAPVAAIFTAAAAIAGCSADGFDLGGVDPAGNDVAATDGQALSPPNDPLFGQQWALRNIGQTLLVTENSVELTGDAGIDINILKAWDVTQGSPTVVVGIIETLDPDLTHPDLAGNLFINPGESGARANNGIDDDGNGYVDDVSGFDFVDRDGFNNPTEHATHVAAIIAGRVQDGVGISGVAPKVKFMPLRAQANTASMVEAIAYAKRMGVKIVNVSQGGLASEGYNSPAVFAAIRDSGMLFTASAGNLSCVPDDCRGNADLNYPSSFDLPNIISVGNLDSKGRLAPGSFYGEANVDIAAPGTGILSAVPGGAYEFKLGTSQAAPQVAGVAALLLSKFPTMTPVQLADRILRTGMKSSSLDKLVKTSAVLDAAAALNDVGPIAVSASAVPGRITLTWTAQAGATRYQVERDGTMVDNGTSRTFVHAGLAVGSAHIYRVRAIVGTTAGAWSHRTLKRAGQDPAVVAFSTASPHPYLNDSNQDYTVEWPNATLLRAHFSRVSIGAGDALSWEISNYEESSLVNYRFDYPTGFWGNWVRGRFSFSLRADSVGNAYGFAIDRLEVVTAIPDVPGAPFLNDVVPGAVTIGFDGTPGSKLVHIYRSTASLGGYVRIRTVDASVFQYQDSTVLAGRTYYYRVSAANDLGESAQSELLRVVAQ